MKRGDVWLVALDPTVGSEIRKTRPCVIVSPDAINAHLRTCIGAPLTSGSHAARFRVPVRFQRKDGLILLDQLRTFDRARLIKRMGHVDGATLAQVLSILRELFGE